MKHAVACLLILTLVIPASARERTLLEQAKKIAPGTMVAVRLKDGQLLTGYLRDVGRDRLMLGVTTSAGWSERDLSFQEIQNIAIVKQPSRVKRYVSDVIDDVLAATFVIWFPLYLIFCHHCFESI